MKAAFSAPKTTAEFKQKAEETTIDAARAMLNALNNKKRLATAELDAEIDFYERVIAYKENISNAAR